MNLTIELPSEKVAALVSQAKQLGLPVERYLGQIIEQHLQPMTFFKGLSSGRMLEQLVQEGPVQPLHLQDRDPKEWERQFESWVDSHDQNTPVLSDEAMSRDSIYPDRT